MNRRHFLNALAHLGGSLYLNPSFMNPLIDPWPSRSYHCANGIRIHALATGSVRVKKTHRQPSALGMAAILFDPRWTNALPVHCWLIEHPEGLILIDTGESARFHEKDHLACDPGAGWVNQRILRFESWQERDDRQNREEQRRSPSHGGANEGCFGERSRRLRSLTEQLARNHPESQSVSLRQLPTPIGWTPRTPTPVC